MENIEEIELYKNFLKGDNESFNKIILIYQNTLVNFILGYVHNIEVAQDLAQDTFVYVLINKKEYDFKYSLKTYLYTIAKCRAINYLKRQRKKVEFKEFYINEIEVNDFDINIIKDNNIEVVRKCIRKLKQEYQVVIFLKYFQNFQYKEIAKILNKTLAQIKMLIYRAKKSLKKNLEKEGFKYE